MPVFGAIFTRPFQYGRHRIAEVYASPFAVLSFQSASNSASISDATTTPGTLWSGTIQSGSFGDTVLPNGHRGLIRTVSLGRINNEITSPPFGANTIVFTLSNNGNVLASHVVKVREIGPGLIQPYRVVTVTTSEDGNGAQTTMIWSYVATENNEAVSFGTAANLSPVASSTLTMTAAWGANDNTGSSLTNEYYSARVIQ